MLFLRSLVFNITFFVWSAALHIILLPVLALPPKQVLACGRFWGRSMAWLLRTLLGITSRVEGLTPELRRLIDSGQVIIAAKHQSSWETIFFPVLLGEPAYVLKRELLLIPLFGWYMKRAHMVAIDRKGGAKALRRMITEAKASIANRRPLVIFPEGTRTRPGERRAYQPGIAALYSRLELPVIPVALNSGQVWGRRQFLKRPGEIVVRFLPAIAPGLARDPFMEKLENAIETASEALQQLPVSPAAIGVPLNTAKPLPKEELGQKETKQEHLLDVDSSSSLH